MQEGVTVLIGAPTFRATLVESARDGGTGSLDLVVSGAEN